MARYYTTTETLPEAMQELYEITEPLEGGPVFDLPNYRQTGVDFSKLDVTMAEVLIARKWPYLRRKEPAVAGKTASEPPPDLAQDSPDAGTGATKTKKG